jgi:hypothetical protein
VDRQRGLGQSAGRIWPRTATCVTGQRLLSHGNEIRAAYRIDVARI